MPDIRDILNDIEKRMEGWPADKTGSNFFVEIPDADARVLDT